MTNCPNYIICNNMLSDETGLCVYCEMLFGKWRGFTRGILEIHNNSDCTTCFKKNICITRPSCDHIICIDCFKNTYFENTLAEVDDSELSEYLEKINSYKKCKLCTNL